MEPLTPADLERMRREHVPRQWGRDQICDACSVEPVEGIILWPCDAARLLAELERRQQVLVSGGCIQFDALTHAHITPQRDGIAYGLLGPATSEELT